jgi:hypothetical protein
MTCVHLILCELRISCESTCLAWLLCLYSNALDISLLETNFLLKTLSLFCRNDSPILDIKWHRTLNSEQPKLIATNKNVVRIWDPETVRSFPPYRKRSFSNLFSLINGLRNLLDIQYPFLSLLVCWKMGRLFSDSLNLSDD